MVQVQVQLKTPVLAVLHSTASARSIDVLAVLAVPVLSSAAIDRVADADEADIFYCYCCYSAELTKVSDKSIS